jgi:hypothetical protein
VQEEGDIAYEYYHGDMNTIIVSSIADVVTACNNNNECLAVTGATAPKPVTKDDENENEELKDLLIDPGSDKKENMANNSAISSCTVDVNKEDEFTDKRVAKIFSVISSNKLHQNNNGRVNRIFFGTVEKPIGGKELKLWKIIFDDGDEDILTHVHLLNAIILYDQNKKYDKQSNSLPLLLDEEMDSIDIASTRIKHGKKKAKAPPKRGKKTHSSKVPRARELEPISVGPPDEELSGGWPAGVSILYTTMLRFILYSLFFIFLTVHRLIQIVQQVVLLFPFASSFLCFVFLNNISWNV